MVRSIASFLFVGACVSTNIKLDSMLHDHGAALEAEYRQLLQDMIDKSHNPNEQAYVPSKNYMEAAEKHFGFLKNDLLTQRAENQELIDHANARITACNENATSFFNAPDTGINALASKAGAARSTHSQCRVVEQQKIDKYTASKGDFDAQKTAGCGNEQDWWASEDAGAGTFSALVDAGVEADADKTAKEAQEAQCDKDQHAFEEAFCRYGKLLDATCAHFDTCYEDEVGSRTDIQGTVEELETSQKLVWKMVQKIECYIGYLKNADNHTPTADDLKTCTEMVPEAGDLDIVYTQWDPPVACDTSPVANKPGSTGWMTDEYATDTFSSLVLSAEKDCS